MNKRSVTMYGIALLVVQIIINLGIFVKFPDMQAYAVSKDSFSMVINRLDRIESKLDKLIEVKQQ